MDRRGFNHNRRDTRGLNGSLEAYGKPWERVPLPGDRYGRVVPDSVRSEWGSEVASVAGSESTGYYGGMESEDDGTTIYGAASRTGTRGSTYRPNHNSSASRLRQSLPVQDQMFGYSGRGSSSYRSPSESRFDERRYQTSEPSESDFRRSTPPPNFRPRQAPIQKEVSAWSTYQYEERPKIVPGKRDQPPPEWMVGKSEFSARHKFAPPKQVSGYPDDDYVPPKRSNRTPLPPQGSVVGSSRASTITNGTQPVNPSHRAPGLPYSEPPRVAIGWGAPPSAPVPGVEEFPPLPFTSTPTIAAKTTILKSVPELRQSSIQKMPLSKPEPPTSASKKIAGGWGISLVSSPTTNVSPLSPLSTGTKASTVVATPSTSAVQSSAVLHLSTSNVTQLTLSVSEKSARPFKSGWTDISGVVREGDVPKSLDERNLIGKLPIEETRGVEQQSTSALTREDAYKVSVTSNANTIGYNNDQSPFVPRMKTPARLARTEELVRRRKICALCARRGLPSQKG